MSVKEKLALLGLTLPTAAAPVAAYVPAVKTRLPLLTAGTQAATGAAGVGRVKPSAANFSLTLI